MAVVWWLLAVEAVGLATFPLAFSLLRPLPSRGYALSKALGLVLLTVALWLPGSLRLIPSTRWTVLGLLLALALVGGLLAWRARRDFLSFLRREAGPLLWLEGLFLVAFALWTLYRVYDPDIAHTEQPMDFGLLNTSLRALYFPPEDMWLRGQPVSYYYLGYLMMAGLARLTATAPGVAYNLSLSLVGALLFQVAAGLAYDLVRAQGARPLPALATSLTGAVLVSVVGNLEGGLELVRARGMGSASFWSWAGVKGITAPSPSQGWVPPEPNWWWRASRVIDTLKDGRSLDFTITEFPFFSLLLGDLHPHLMSAPFLLTAVGLALGLYLRPLPLGWGHLRGELPLLVVAGLLAGALGPINTFDLPTGTALVVGALALRSATAEARAGPRWRALVWAVGTLAVVVVAVVPYIPFYRGFHSQASGVLPLWGPVTRYFHLFLVLGLFLAGLAPFLVGQLRRALARGPALPWLIALSISSLPFLLWALLAVALGSADRVLGRLGHILPFVALTTLALGRALGGGGQKPRPAEAFTLGLVFLAGMLVLGPELFFVRDLFGTRMNTVFKLYYQAWPLLAVSTAFALYCWAREGERLRAPLGLVSPLWGVVFLLLLGASLYYPAVAPWSKSGGFRSPPALDGTAYLARQQPGEHAVIEWLRRNALPGEGLLEAEGDDYSPFGRISAFTGVPTVLAWPGHQLQWRGSSEPFAGRAEEVREAYTTPSAQRARDILRKYNVTYVVVGPRERARYGAAGLAKFRRFMEVVLEADGFVLYRLRE